MARSGDRKPPFIRSLDYGCVTRFRTRRLLAFLWLHRYDGAFEGLSKDTKVLFRPDHLQHLVREGLWHDAIRYVYCFQPAGQLPRGAGFLVKFLRFVSRVSKSNTYEYDPSSPLQIFLHGGVSPAGIKLAEIISSVRSEEVWASINWPRVRNKAAEIVGQLAAQIEGLNDMRRLPLCPTKAANVLPIGLGSRSRRGLQNKSSRKMPAYDLAQSFLSKRLPSSSQGSSQSGVPLESLTMTRLASLIEECLQAGKCGELNKKNLIQSPYNEGTGG
ncbi:hypothetical protein EJB05_38331 [Eragrostis curvula]|uniref:Uncharacterized protein n=1 Tax=Eragrostis curvula TaxID=38414 RepID=A0A5J9TU68_9POAL|nr:hypothetical protein EJB05_38331 [Eragrostis curvula]